MSDLWRTQNKLSPVVYIRESTWGDRNNIKNGIRKENGVCLTVDM